MSRTFTEFRESKNHWSMNWTEFKDPVSHMYLTGTVVASWSLTQEVAVWQVRAFNCNDKYFLSLDLVNSEKNLGKTPMHIIISR